jgi:hypothetical protein
MSDAPAIDVPEEPRPFHYDGTVPPGEKRHLRYEISETYLGDPVEVPVTVINGTEPGPRLCLTAAVHGDELNGVNVCPEVAKRYSPKAGSSWNSKRAPPASLSVTVACQPCASAIVSTIASPKPVLA